MYESYYGLTEKPFSIQPDPEYLFLSKRHNLAYTMLEYSIQNHAGYTVICGDIGCGKTTLIHHLMNNYKSELTVGLLVSVSVRSCRVLHRGVQSTTTDDTNSQFKDIV